MQKLHVNGMDMRFIHYKLRSPYGKKYPCNGIERLFYFRMRIPKGDLYERYIVALHPVILRPILPFKK